LICYREQKGSKCDDARLDSFPPHFIEQFWRAIQRSRRADQNVVSASVRFEIEIVKTLTQLSDFLKIATIEESIEEGVEGSDRSPAAEWDPIEGVKGRIGHEGSTVEGDDVAEEGLFGNEPPFLGSFIQDLLHLGDFLGPTEIVDDEVVGSGAVAIGLLSLRIIRARVFEELEGEIRVFFFEAEKGGESAHEGGRWVCVDDSAWVLLPQIW